MYTVLVTEPAHRDMQEQRDWWAEHRSAEQAVRWYADFFRALLTLEKSPELHPRAAEDGLWPFAVHQLNFDLGRQPTHRALYVIRKTEVIVLRIRHLAQASLTFEDI